MAIINNDHNNLRLSFTLTDRRMITSMNGRSEVIIGV